MEEKEKNYLTISIDAEKIHLKNSVPIHNKKLQ